MRLSRPTKTLALTCLLGVVLGTAAACGGNEVEPGTGALDSTTDPTPTIPSVPTPSAPTPSVPTPSITRTPTPTPSPAPADGGDGDAEGDDAPATAGGGVCSDLGADEVGAVLGVALKGAGIPGGGCRFDQGGRQGSSVTVQDKSNAEAGGMAGAKNEATSAVEGEPEDLTGIGSAAFVVTGTMFGGTDVQAAGAVRVGNRVISVFLVQRSAIPAAEVRALEVDLLALVAREAS